MTKLPPISGSALIKKLRQFGFEVIRQRGSHVIMKNMQGIITIIPNHKGKDIDQGLIRKILKQAQISLDDYLA